MTSRSAARARAFLHPGSPWRAAKRFAPWVLAWWLLFWVAAVLQPCCDALAAAIPHGHASLLLDRADPNGANPGEPGQSPHSHCPQATSADLYAGQEAAAPADPSRLSDGLPSLPSSGLKTPGFRETSHPDYRSPPPPPRVYLLTQRLLN